MSSVLIKTILLLLILLSISFVMGILLFTQSSVEVTWQHEEK